jgi:hypothetical protein
MATLAEKKQLIEEIKGVRRVVINNCHGGFGLSHEAIILYHELQGKPLWTVYNEGTFNTLIPWRYFTLPEDQRVEPLEGEAWHAASTQERIAHNQAWDRQTFTDRDVERDDPYLVKVVQQLGSKANGRHSDLKVVEIPADVDWIIEEYDGAEWIAEKHRTWK